MSDATRRRFLAWAGAGAAAGATAFALPTAAGADEDHSLPAGAEGAMAAYVRDVKKGEVVVMVDGHEVVVTDRKLVARLARAYSGARKS